MPSVLIVEDSDYSRALLRQQLTKLGIEAHEAADGVQAWELLKDESINVVITDWEMPEMDGIELCRRIRAANFSRYIYIILLTVKAERADMVTGIEAGADNFLVKPVTTAQLRVMLYTARRVLDYERRLLHRNKKLEKVSSELKRGMRAAANFHKTLLPEPMAEVHGIRFQSYSKPCTYTTGDMFNFFPLDDDHVLFYLLDVAGHGIPAAMLSFTLSHFLTVTPHEPHQREAHLGFLNFYQPSEVVGALNRRFYVRTDDWLSFTMIYCVINRRSRQIRFVQAGHPPLIFQPKNQPARTMGDGGFPVGYFADAVFEEHCFSYEQGDRIFLYSDGLTECHNREKLPYGVSRLINGLEQSRHLSLEETLQQVVQDVEQWQGSDHFSDDLSLLALEFGPSERDEE